ncbi:MAG: LysM peptidoglycan-binding domain-containing protein [Planctomycetaceae bacterium]
MHQDQKIGLSLAVLLIGFAGAFCFRQEPVPQPQRLVLERADELDARIEHLPIRAYTEREGGGAPGARRNGSGRPVAADGPLTEVLDLERPPLPSTGGNARDQGNLIALFAGPPEPLRIAQDLALARPERSVSAFAPVAPAGIGAAESLPPAESKTSRPGLSTRTAVSAVMTNQNPLSREATHADTTDSNPVGAEAVADEQHAGVPYKVCSGDTLSELAQRFLGSARRYPELYEANRDVLSSPDSLRAGTVLRIPVAP